MFNKTADGIIAKFTQTIKELEKHGDAQLARHLDLNEQAQAAKGEYTRAFDYADKLKKIFQ